MKTHNSNSLFEKFKTFRLLHPHLIVLTFALTICAISIFSVCTFSQQEEPLLNKKIQEKLGLTTEQISQIKSMRTEKEKKSIELEAKLKLLELELRELLEEDNPDVKKVDAKIDEIGKISAEVKKVEIHTLLKLKTLLTPEQKEKIEKLKEEKVQEMRDRRGERKDQRGFKGEGQGKHPEDMPPAPPPAPRER